MTMLGRLGLCFQNLRLTLMNSGSEVMARDFHTTPFLEFLPKQARLNVVDDSEMGEYEAGWL